jgi:hypothetical protein
VHAEKVWEKIVKSLSERKGQKTDSRTCRAKRQIEVNKVPLPKRKPIGALRNAHQNFHVKDFRLIRKKMIK